MVDPTVTPVVVSRIEKKSGQEDAPFLKGLYLPERHWLTGKRILRPELRCNGLNSLGEQCGGKKVKGTEYCHHCGNNRSYTAAKKTFQQVWDSMPGLYSKHLGPALAERVEEMLAIPLNEQTSLYDELALSRGMLVNACAVLKKLEEKKAAGKDINPATETAIYAAIHDGVGNVSALVEKIVKIEKMADGNISVTQLGFFVASLTKIIHDVLGTDRPDDVRRLTEAVRTNLRLPKDSRESGGITISATLDDLPQ